MSSVLRYFVIVAASVVLASCGMMGTKNNNGSSTYDQAQLASSAASVLSLQKQEPAKKRIPESLLANAKCVGVFPSIVKAGLIIGGDRGKGLVSCRQGSGGWSQSAPAIYTITGGSIGLQAGVKSSSVILLFMNQDSENALLDSQFKLGADIGVTAGPVGLHAHVASGSDRPVLAYVTNRNGVFAGVSLNGNVMDFDASANKEVYGPAASPRSVLLGSHKVPEIMEPYSHALANLPSAPAM